jgi:metal-sulfur cluster biosynthetic enzyme
VTRAAGAWFLSGFDQSSAKTVRLLRKTILPEALRNLLPLGDHRWSTGSRVMVDGAGLLETLKEVVDPELMINIVDLGLIYDIEQVDNKVTVQMTLTSPACPAGPQIIQQAKMALEKLADVSEAEIKLVMSPPWTPDRMTDEARDQLGIF